MLSQNNRSAKRISITSIVALAVLAGGTTACDSSENAKPTIENTENALSKTSPEITSTAAAIGKDFGVQVEFGPNLLKENSEKVLLALKEFQRVRREKPEAAGRYKKIEVVYSNGSASAVDESTSSSSTLVIDSSNTAEAIKYSFQYMPNERGAFQKSNATTIQDLSAKYGISVRSIARNSSSDLSDKWALEFLTHFMNESKTNLVILKSAGDIYLTNSNKVSPKSVSIDSHSMTETSVRSTLDSIPETHFRFAKFYIRASAFGAKLGIKVDIDGIFAQLDYIENAFAKIEAEALRPDNGLHRLERVKFGTSNGLSMSNDKLTLYAGDKGDPSVESLLELLRGSAPLECNDRGAVKCW